MKDYQVEEWKEIVGRAEHCLKHSSFPIHPIYNDIIVTIAKEMQLMRDFIYEVANEEIDKDYASFAATALLQQISE